MNKILYWIIPKNKCFKESSISGGVMRHKPYLILISAMIIFSFNACSFQNSKEEQEGKESSSELTVLNWSKSKIDDVISQFSTLHPEIKVQDKRYFDNDEGGFKEKAITELMAGGGPDILVFRVKEFPNLHKILENDTLYDLNKLIEKSKSFKLEEYNKTVMDSGVYEDERNLIPLYSNLPVMITTKSFLSNQGISIPDNGVTWPELAQMAKKFVSNSNNKGKYMFSNDFNYENLMQCSYMKYIDYTKRNSSFDSNEFISLLNICKEIQPAVCPTEIAKKANSAEHLAKGTVGFVRDDDTMELSNLFSYNSICKQYFGEEMYLIPFPSDQKNVDIIGNVRVMVGINANCKRPKEAFEFLELLLKKENQTPYMNINKNYVKGSPVNIDAWNEELKYYMGSGLGIEKHLFGDETGVIEFIPSPLSSKMGAEIDQLYRGITRVEFGDYRVLTILTEETKAFLSGKASAEETAKNINQKVMLYLNE